MISGDLRPEMERRSTARDRVLAALVAAGPRGVTNTELNTICYRYGARLFELKTDWVIEREAVVGGVYRYILRGRREFRQEALFL